MKQENIQWHPAFVESRHPRDLLTHLKETRGYKVEESVSGIYTVKGDILPIQVIDSRWLPVGENSWLRDLCDSLKPVDLQRVIYGIHRQGKTARTKAYLDAITRANKDSLKEAFRMSSTTLTLEEILEEVGFYARAEERHSLKIAKKMIESGFPLETVISMTELEPEKVKGLFEDALKPK